jgi:predicted PurR-regulated permease PerM
MTTQDDDPTARPAAEPDSPEPAVPEEESAELTPAGGEPVGPATVEPVVVSRLVQAVAAGVALLGLAALIRAAAPVVMLFVVAAVVALVINPLVVLLQRLYLPRGVAIGVVFVGFFAAIGGVIAVLTRPVANQVAVFRDNLPELITSANGSLADLQRWLDLRGVGIQIKAPGQTALDTLQDSIVRGSRDVISFTRDLVTMLAETGFILILTLVVTIYMLIYGHQIGALARNVMPSGDGTADDDYPTRVQRAVSGYVRGQVVFSLIMGFSAGVALWLLGAVGIFPAGRTYAVFFGVFYGLMELVPYLGPVLGAAPPILVALLQGEPLTALWLVILFVVLQQLEGHVVAPQVFGHHLRINPLLVIFALLVGGDLYGIPGALVALPIAAVARETVLYLRRHLMLEPWGTPSAAALAERERRESAARLAGHTRPREWPFRGLGGARAWFAGRRSRPAGSPQTPDQPDSQPTDPVGD